MVSYMESLFMFVLLARLACADTGEMRETAPQGDDSQLRDVILQDGASFEYIVVGAGAAGCAAAARLALAGARVLLVETGGDAGLLSKVPAAAQALLGSSIDYQYETISNNISCLGYKKRHCLFSRGKALGGSTTINYMIHTRGNPQDFNELDIPGWTWEDMKPYFLRYEGLQVLSKLPESSIPYHNTTGPMKMEFFTDPENPWHSRLIEGFESINVPYNYDVNAASQIGVTQVIGYVYDNERMSSARGYLEREDVRSRLNVAKFTKCTGVIIEDGIARGITVTHGILKMKWKFYATKEVILSAGTIETPHLLMLSGIGPAQHLNKFNIPVVADLPVGNNMTDHVLPLLFMKVDKVSGFAERLAGITQTFNSLADLLFMRSGPLTSNGLTDVTAFLNSNCYDFEKRQLTNDSRDCEVPTIQYIHAYIDRGIVWLGRAPFQHATGLNDEVTEQLAKISSEYGLLVFSPLILRTYSQGTVRLASADPHEPPAIFPNFLSDERDLEEMVRALTIIEHMEDTPTYKKHNATIVHLKLPGCPDYEVGNAQNYWRCYARHMTQSCFHAVGTAALGGALDARLRVRGVRRLRVADLSALPHLPRANTAASALAIGERLADFILHPDD